MKPTLIQCEFIRELQSFDSGGNCPVDLVVLKDGRVIGISGECAVLYPSLDAFYEFSGNTLAAFDL